MRGWTVEVTPQAAAKVKSFTAHLEHGHPVNVTFLPGSDIEDTIAVCERLRGEGMTPVPHVAARSLQSEGHLEQYLSQLTERARVEEVLVIGGGVDNPVGPFHESMQVLETGLLQRFGIRKVGLAAHPEGSPDIGEPDLLTALRRKNEWARTEMEDAGSPVEKVYLETQFCFDPAAIIAWDRAMADDGPKGAGNCLPVKLGVAGPANIKTLIKFAQMSGVGPSVRVLTRNPLSLLKVATKQAPDALVAGLAEYMATDPGCNIEGLHFYSFGGLKGTAAWARAAAAGNFDLSGDGFTVRE
jgi:methylenetetrahydrofolate reductase (NADPH)